MARIARSTAYLIFAASLLVGCGAPRAGSLPSASAGTIVQLGEAGVTIRVPQGYSAPQLMTAASAGFLEYDIRYKSPGGNPPLEGTGHFFALSVYPVHGATPPDFVGSDLNASLRALTNMYAKPPLQVIISRHTRIAGQDAIEVRLLDPFGDLKQEAMLIDGEGRLITIDGLQDFDQVPRGVQEAAFDELVSSLALVRQPSR